MVGKILLHAHTYTHPTHTKYPVDPFHSSGGVFLLGIVVRVCVCVRFCDDDKNMGLLFFVWWGTGFACPHGVLLFLVSFLFFCCIVAYLHFFFLCRISPGKV